MRKPSRRYREVNVWNNATGDIVKTLRDATDEQVDELREQYEDEPFMEVVIDDR